MAQVYVIYLRSNPNVHDVISTRRTAAEDFRQFVNPVPGSYVEGRTQANPTLYKNMNAVDFLVLQPPQSWSQTDHANPVASWRSRPVDVVAAITAASPAPPLSWTPKSRWGRSLATHKQPWTSEERDTEFFSRWISVRLFPCGDVQTVYPPEVRREFQESDGSPKFQMYLTEEGLLELRDACRNLLKPDVYESDDEEIQQIDRLLAYHEQLHLKEGKS